MRGGIRISIISTLYSKYIYSEGCTAKVEEVFIRNLAVIAGVAIVFGLMIVANEKGITQIPVLLIVVGTSPRRDLGVPSVRIEGIV